MRDRSRQDDGRPGRPASLAFGTGSSFVTAGVELRVPAAVAPGVSRPGQAGSRTKGHVEKKTFTYRL